MDKQLELQAFCERYFSLVKATIHPSDEYSLCVELPQDVDKELTDRPFYWMWIDALKETPPPTLLYFLFSDQTPSEQYTKILLQNQKPEVITSGCYRMQKIYLSAKSRGAYAVAYERGTSLWPFVLINIKVSFIADRQKDELYTYVTDIKKNVVKKIDMEDFAARPFSDELPSQAKIYPIPINYDQVFERVLLDLHKDISRLNHSWAKEANARLQKELSELSKYYNSLDNQNEHEAEMELRKAEMSWRIAPRIEVQPFQLALLYMTST